MEKKINNFPDNAFLPNKIWRSAQVYDNGSGNSHGVLSSAVIWFPL